jgi:hypothetical protein
MTISSSQYDLTVGSPTVAPYDPLDPYNQLTISGVNGPTTLNSVFIGQEEFIKGEMVTVQNVVKDFEITQMMIDADNFKQEMKKKLAHQIAEKLLENKLVEFTKQENLNTNEITFRARAYLVKDDKVRTLRKYSER